MRRASISLATEKSQLDKISDTVKGGYLAKKGRGRTLSFVKPWANRYVSVDSSTGVLSYFVEKEG
jgi:hypothetical protein